MRALVALLLAAAAACSPRQDPDHRCDLDAPGAAWLAFSSLRSGDHDVRMARADGTCDRLLAGGPSTELHPAWASPGVIAFTSDRSGELRIWTHDLASGAEAMLATSTVAASSPAFSPDGATVAFEGTAAGTTIAHLHLVPATGGTPIPLAPAPANDAGPVWSPDGATIYFVSYRSGPADLHAVDVATGAVTRLTTGSRIIGRPAVSPAGDRLYYARTVAGSSSTEVVRLTLPPTLPPTLDPVVISSQGDSEPAVSPGGDRLALRTFRYGEPNAEVVIVDEADGGHAVRITLDPGSDGGPAFAP